MHASRVHSGAETELDNANVIRSGRCVSSHRYQGSNLSGFWVPLCKPAVPAWKPQIVDPFSDEREDTGGEFQRIQVAKSQRNDTSDAVTDGL